MDAKPVAGEIAAWLKPENSARSFKNPAPIVARFFGQEPRVKPSRAVCVLEIGAGCLRNALFLQRLGYKVEALENTASIRKWSDRYARFRLFGGSIHNVIPSRRKFDFVLCTFVLETIPKLPTRLRLLKNIRKLLKPKGRLILGVRGYGDVKTRLGEGKRYRDGYITPLRTFIRPYTLPEILTLVKRCGLEPVAVYHRHSTKKPRVINVVAARK